MRLRKDSTRTLEVDDIVDTDEVGSTTRPPPAPDRPPRKVRASGGPGVSPTPAEPAPTAETAPIVDVIPERSPSADPEPTTDPVADPTTDPTTDPVTDPVTQQRDEQVRRTPSTLVLATAGLALVALVVMALGGLSWYRASHDDVLAAAKTRDRALIAASTEIATLNTLDYRDVDGGLKSWLAVTTGTLHDQLAQAGSQDTELLAGQKKISTGKVVAAAITDLDAPGGTATAIASVEVTVRGTSGAPSIKRNRFSANLVLVKGRWLLESLTQVPVDAS